MKKPVLSNDAVTRIDHEGKEASAAACREQTERAVFRCPDCLMADTCSDCSQHGSDGRCNKFGGYTDPDKWACSWYYSH